MLTKVYPLIPMKDHMGRATESKGRILNEAEPAACRILRSIGGEGEAVTQFAPVPNRG